MTDKVPVQGTGMTLGDVLYILFRHKWKIAIFSCLAFAASFSVRMFIPKVYQSEARLYIRYVMDARTPTLIGDNDSRVRAPDPRGDSILQTELQILTSMDLAEEVADAIGPDNLFRNNPANAVLGPQRLVAASMILKNLQADVPRDTSVIQITFRHSNPEVVQQVLKQLISSYFKKHAEIRAVGAFDELLTQETDNRRDGIAQTEEELRKAKAKAGVVLLEDTQRSFSTEISRLQQAILDTQAQLAERRASASELAKSLHAPFLETNQTPVTNRVESVSSEKTDEYRRVCASVDSLSRKEQQLLDTYTSSNSLVQVVHEQLENNQRTKRELEKSYPGLLAFGVSQPKAPSGSGEPAADPRDVLGVQLAQVSGLEAKLNTLKDQLVQVRDKANALAQQEGLINQLQRRLNIEETNYSHFAQSLEQSRLDEKLGAGKVSNISIIQEPTPAMAAKSKRLNIMGIVLLCGLSLAFGIPFLLELYLDQSIKRPIEIESRLRLPLFLSIPRLNGHATKVLGSSLRLLSSKDKVHENIQSQDTNGSLTPVSSRRGLSPWDPRHPLQPFFEGLRDRLMTYFEIKQMTHKPKLVALTSCANGAGVSTIAAGLAASLSETGEGNVLLVDMNLENGGAAYFHKGNLSCGLDEALEMDKRDVAFVHEKLYMVSEAASDKLPSALPKRFKSLVPRLKASDYDYIIFDMPPVSRISLTPRLSRFMDTILLVVESEETSRDLVKRASELLAESQANVGIVLNKERRYVPRKLQQDL